MGGEKKADIAATLKSCVEAGSADRASPMRVGGRQRLGGEKVRKAASGGAAFQA